MMENEKPVTPRCSIPHHALDDPWVVVNSYTLKEIKEACAFKRRALEGAQFLSQDRITGHIHEEYADSIERQIKVLEEAACIRTGSDTDD